MNWTLTITGEFIISFPIPEVGPRGIPQSREGVAFFCVTCAKVWATLTTPGRVTIPSCMPCREHSDSKYRPGGSVWLMWDRGYCAALPLPVLLREADLHLSVLEREPVEVQTKFEAFF